ncbi:Alpha-L-fucosidase [Halotydeus destructor]|nr:Alpha-L-fucosidase [Halotydeus destructor]
MKALVLFLFIFPILIDSLPKAKKYEPTWESIDSRPLPSWYDESKIGIFIHWGVFSVPSFGSEWFWWNWQGTTPSPSYVDFMTKNYKPGFSYAEFGPQFTAEFYDPNRWAKLFKGSGAKYIVLVSKHHEGFTLWPSKNSWNWNALEVGPKRDLLGDLATAVRAEGLKFGVYHSMYEWFNPLYNADKATGYKTQKFVDTKTLPELYDLVNTYKPEVVWSDGDWDAPDTYWRSRDFIAWLYNESPVKDSVVINDRWGNGVMCHHGGFITCSDRFNPGVLQPRKWENAMTLDMNSWGYSRTTTLSEYLSIKELLLTLASTVAYGGNLLVNVGPTHDGRIIPVMEERLTQMGQWLDTNGEAIYKSHPWSVAQNDSVTSNVYYTQSSDNKNVYATFFDWPENHNLTLGSVRPSSQSTIIQILSPNPQKLQWAVISSGDLQIQLQPYPVGTQWAWTLKFTNL